MYTILDNIDVFEVKRYLIFLKCGNKQSYSSRTLNSRSMLMINCK